MQHKFSFVLISTFMAFNTFGMELSLSNEEQMKHSLRTSSFSGKWESMKQQITESINAGVSTVDVQEFDDSGYTPLCKALSQNDIPFALFLLDKGADPNFSIKGVHSSKPIFFAHSVEMVQLLKLGGADLKTINEGCGVTGGMNLLHSSIQCNTQDNRLFDYFLEQEGLDHKECTKKGENLWHRLISISICYCPEERFTKRAKKLHELGISPHQEDDFRGKSAIQIMKDNIADETKYLSRALSRGEYVFSLEDRKLKLAKLERFLKIMQKK